MKRLVFAAVAALVIASPLLAQTAKVVRVSGKVEIMRPRGEWVAAGVGDEFPLGTTISTGFRSQALIEVASAQLTVLALTRLTIQELLQTDTSVTTTLSLDTGKVRAQVRTAPGQTADFKLRSPVSTAAVRGTDFYFDGYRLDVIEGVVQFLNRLGQSQYVAGGNGSQTNGDDEPSYPEDDRLENALVSSDTEGDGGGGGETEILPITGRLVVTIQ